MIAHLLGELGYANRPDEVHERLCRIAARPDAAVVVAMNAGEIAGVASYQVIDLLERPHPQCRITTLVVKDGGRRVASQRRSCGRSSRPPASTDASGLR